MNIASVDLNLLVAFEALLEERNVTRAAARVGLSQPAMSNALARLRALLGDPLFLRTARGMAPTARALLLAAPVRSALAQLRTALAGPRGFDPSSSARTFRLATTDYAEWIIVAPLLRRIRESAPGAQILVRRLERLFQVPEEELRSGTLDAALGFFPDASALEPGTHVQELFEEDNVCIARKGHPLLRKRLTAEQFASALQIGIFYRSDTRGLIDNVLAEQGLRRRLQVTTPHFLAVPGLVAESDLIACVPVRLAHRFRKLLPIQVRKLPFALPAFHLRLAWHERTDDDPAQQWFRETIVKAASSARKR